MQQFLSPPTYDSTSSFVSRLFTNVFIFETPDDFVRTIVRQATISFIQTLSLKYFRHYFVWCVLLETPTTKLLISAYKLVDRFWLRWGIFSTYFFSISLSFLLIRIFKYLFKAFSFSFYYTNISFFLSHIYTQVNPLCFRHCNSFSSKLKLLPTSHIHSCINVATLSKCKTSNSMKALAFLTQIIM